MRIAKEALEIRGFELVNFTLTKEELLEFNEVMNGLVGNYNVIPILNTMTQNYEPWVPQYGGLAAMLRYPWPFRALLRIGFKLTGNGRIWDSVKSLKVLETKELDELMKRLTALQLHMKDKWEALGIEAVIMPNYPIPAFTSANVEQVGSFRDYQIIWSLLHYPAGALPITTVQESEASYGDDGFNDMWTRALQKDIVTSAGMPVGVQVISRKWDDEIALAVMKVIDEEVKAKISPPLILASLL